MLIAIGHSWVFASYPALDKGPLRSIFAYSAGYLAIDLLFILSGWVLFLPMAKEGTLGSIKGYALRRVARIVPLYYLTLILVIVFRSFLTEANPSSVSPSSVLAHMAFLHTTLLPISQQGFGVVGAVWTLSIEACFYLLLPLVAGWFRVHPLRGLLLALFASALWRVATSIWLARIGEKAGGSIVDSLEARLSFQFPAFVFHFALGMAACLLYVRLDGYHLSNRAAMGIRMVQILMMLGLAMIAYHQGNVGFRGEATVADHRYAAPYRLLLMTTLMLATSLLGARLSKPPIKRASHFLSRVSYGIYLTHMPLLAFGFTTLGMETGTNGAFFVAALLTVSVSTLMGSLSSRFIEEPARQFARRRKPQNLASSQP